MLSTHHFTKDCAYETVFSEHSFLLDSCNAKNYLAWFLKEYNWKENNKSRQNILEIKQQY